MAFRLTDLLRKVMGGEDKEKSVFASDKEAYDFCRRVYNASGGATPELRRAYEFYQKALNDDGKPEVRPSNAVDEAHAH